MVKQVKDSGGEAVPLLGYASHRGQQVPYTTSANLSAQLSSQIVTVTASTNCFIETGDNTVQAYAENSHFILGSVPYDFTLGAETPDRYISVIGVSSGTLYISERK